MHEAAAVSEGETIEADQGIIELETDKATAVVPSPQAGKVLKIHVAEGDTVPVDALLITVDPAAADVAAPAVTPPAPESPPAPQILPAPLVAASRLT